MFLLYFTLLGSSTSALLQQRTASRDTIILSNLKEDLDHSNNRKHRNFIQILCITYFLTVMMYRIFYIFTFKYYFILCNMSYSIQNYNKYFLSGNYSSVGTSSDNRSPIITRTVSRQLFLTEEEVHSDSDNLTTSNERRSRISRRSQSTPIPNVQNSINGDDDNMVNMCFT